ncbi:MAG: NTP transferase domain-containing protein [Anaerolineae bacterium]|nr:NTP transferase domain-containing protein [Anaerolineae bacterium]
MPEELIGLIPAAGKGVRLGLPYPKELYPIIRDNHYKPISQFVVQNMTEAGIQHIVFVVNETKHQLMGYFGNGYRFGCNISYVVQEARDDSKKSTSPGLANALDSAYHLIQGKTVFFGMADTIMQPSNMFAQSYEAALPDDDVIFAMWTTERPEKFGMVRYEENGRVIEIVDKPKQTDLTEMWGGIIWRPRFTEYLHTCVHDRGISDFAYIMNSAIEKGMKFRGVHLKDGVYIDLGTYEEIMELDSRFREKN